MYDTTMDDLLEQIDQVTIQLAELNSQKARRGSFRMRHMLLMQLAGLNAQFHIRYMELYAPPAPWSTRIASSWHMRALALAMSITLATVFAGVFVVPWFQSFVASLQFMARPVP